MRVFSWAASSLRTLASLAGAITGRALLVLLALALITAGAWRLASPEAALLLLGLLILRDVERPDSEAR